METHATNQIASEKIDRFILVIVILLSVGVRTLIVWPAIEGKIGLVGWDDGHYYRLAISVVEKGQLSADGLTAYRMPLYPLFLAAIYKMFGPTLHFAIPFQVVLGILTCIGTYFLGKEIFNRWVGLIGSILVIFDINLITFSAILMTETLFVFLAFFSLFCLERLRKSQRWYWAVSSGLLLGLATLTRPNFGLLTIIVILWVIITGYMDKRKAFINAAIIFSIVAILWGGWIVRNYVVLKAFIPMTTQGGNAYYGIYNDLVASYTDPLKFGNWINRVYPDETLNLSEVEIDKWGIQQAFTWINAHRFLALKLAVAQIILFWSPDAGFIYIICLGISLLCIPTFLKQKLYSPILWIFFSLGITALVFWSVGIPRYRAFLHPFLALMGVFGIVPIGEKVYLKVRALILKQKFEKSFS